MIIIVKLILCYFVSGISLTILQMLLKLTLFHLIAELGASKGLYYLNDKDLAINLPGENEPYVFTKKALFVTNVLMWPISILASLLYALHLIGILKIKVKDEE